MFFKLLLTSPKRLHQRRSVTKKSNGSLHGETKSVMRLMNCLKINETQRDGMKLRDSGDGNKNGRYTGTHATLSRLRNRHHRCRIEQR